MEAVSSRGIECRALIYADREILKEFLSGRPKTKGSFLLSWRGG
jgi:hypothetical protein